MSMNVLLKAIIFAYVAFEWGLRSRPLDIGIAFYLLIGALTVLQEKFLDNRLIQVAVVFAAVASAWHYSLFSFFFCSVVFDLIRKRHYWPTVPAAAAALYLFQGDAEPLGSFAMLVVMLVLYGLFGYAIRYQHEQKHALQQKLDQERQLRYELETAKHHLLAASKEITHITEVKERNRIARQIHDNVGHRIAGVLIHMQAAQKLMHADTERAQSLFRQSVDGLSEAVTMLRETVHNLKPQERLGVDYIKDIIDKFTFCPVDFSWTGSVIELSAPHLELIATNIKEALTNTARYSRATKADIRLDVTEQYTRLYIKDNGVGCANIHEGLGLSGIKERVKDLGGIVSISSNDGFMIVCVIPREEGRALFENLSRR